MKFRDIPQMTQAHYAVHVSWSYLQAWLADHEKIAFDMDPPYQRGYVWTEEQKTAYLEYILKGGISGRDIFWNCPGWMRGFEGPLELVDGKQRISAVLDFFSNKVKVFGHYYKEFEDSLRITDAVFIFHVNNLTNKKDIVQWYLDMNTGGSVHTEKDLQPAYEMMKELER